MLKLERWSFSMLIWLKETEREPETEVDFVVYLLNFEKLVVKIRSYEQTEDVLDVRLYQFVKYNLNLQLLLPVIRKS